MIPAWLGEAALGLPLVGVIWAALTGRLVPANRRECDCAIHTAKRAREAFERAQLTGGIAVLPPGVQIVQGGPRAYVALQATRRELCRPMDRPPGYRPLRDDAWQGWADARPVWGSVAAPHERRAL